MLDLHRQALGALAALRDQQGVRVAALAGMGDVAIVEAEREALAADRAWATERTGH